MENMMLSFMLVSCKLFLLYTCTFSGLLGCFLDNFPKWSKLISTVIRIECLWNNVLFL